MNNLRIAYVVNHVAFFASHRLPLAIEARKAGYDVALFTGQPGSNEMEESAVALLKAEKIVHKRVVFSSSSINPIIEFIGLVQLIWELFKFKPDVIHCASPKGVLYGGIAARICRAPGLVLAVSGMGYAYTEIKSRGVLRNFVRYISDALSEYAFYHRNVQVIVQNRDDYALMLSKRLADESKLTLIPGSGVNLDLFNKCSAYEKSRIILLPARMLRDKGVFEFVEAARKVRKSHPDWRFVLAGAAGYDNPSAVSINDLHSWQREGVVDWRGHVNDTAPLFQKAAIVCLPSYREGMPKALLEAAAACCAIVTTDVAGCREAIDPGVTGDLVPACDSNALAQALMLLIRDNHRRIDYGIKGRERAIKLFSIQSVTNKILGIYEGLTHAH